MKKKSILIIIIIIIAILLYLILSSILIFNNKQQNNLNNQNIFVLTVDDIKLSSQENIDNTEIVLQLLQKHNMPATVFAIPAEMKEYNFSRENLSIEIAQHGYDHYNEKFDDEFNSYKEFKGLSINESKKLILEGKIALEYYGYDVKGFRAPSFYLDKELISFLKDNYEYDSSFILPNNEFSIPIILDDPTQYVCSDKGCNKLWLSIRKKWLFSLMNINDLFNNPNVLIMHSQGIARLMQDKNGRDFLNAIFNEINNRNYKKMTMQEYAQERVK